MAKYRMQEMPDMNNSGKKKLYPRYVKEGKATLEDMATFISEGTTFGPGEVKGLIETLTRNIASEIRRGCTVKIEGLGIFKASLGLKNESDGESTDGESKVNSHNIYVRDIIFKADKKFIDMVQNGIRLTRTTYNNPKSSKKYTEEERLKLAQKFLENNPVMRVSDYCQITGLLPTAARVELKKIVSNPENGIKINGKGSHKVYVKNV
ncbi:MAG: HU family DNA-binding protein [Parabacteroides sp.]|nr:HU family DNA-binding protein [Parabacteroides sp.]